MTFYKTYREIISGYQNNQKSRFDHEYYLYAIYRYLSFPLTAFLIKLKFTADTVTIFRSVTLLICFGLILLGQYTYMVTGALVFLFAYILDFVDGNIARFNNTSNYYGKFIDGLVDSFVCGLFIFSTIGNIRSGHTLFSIRTEMFMGVTTAFASLWIQYFRIRVAYFVNQSQTHSAPNHEMPSKPKAWWHKTMAYFYSMTKQLSVSTPIALIILCPLNLLSVFNAVFFAIYLPMALGEGAMTIWNLKNTLRIEREY
ncbi:MAG: CDP-alcohol phosphatidyltransferase family protein [Bdellovibrionales bacterium]|nr:CDP-alcohol phosphatidyltransferase family protein [Bdellovibrionales bacterium]